MEEVIVKVLTWTYAQITVLFFLTRDLAGILIDTLRDEFGIFILEKSVKGVI